MRIDRGQYQQPSSQAGHMTGFFYRPSLPHSFCEKSDGWKFHKEDLFSSSAAQILPILSPNKH